MRSPMPIESDIKMSLQILNRAAANLPNPCPFCGVTFIGRKPGAQALIHHIAQHHPEEGPPTAAVPGGLLAVQTDQEDPSDDR